MNNIGILTNLDDIFITSLIEQIIKINNVNFYLIICKNENNKKKLNKLFKDRTGDYFKKNNLNLFDTKIKLPAYFVNSHNSKDLYKIIKKNNINFLYNSSTPNKLSKKTLGKVRGIINIHPGLLPHYRGCTCPEWALLNNDPLGITAHLMDEKYDSGPIIKKKYLRFKKKDIKTYQDIRIKIYLSTINLAKKIFILISKNKLKLIKQDNEQSNFYNVISNTKLKIVKKKIKDKIYKFHKKNLI